MPLPPLMPLPPRRSLLAVTDIHERLQAIFPDGTANRNYVTREIAAKTVFVMLYIGCGRRYGVLAMVGSGDADD